MDALRAVLPKVLFLIRDTRSLDYGVDAHLELQLEGRATNCLAQVQLKAVQDADANRDGSVSKQVDVPNLNYLLYGPCAIYVLYVASTDSLWFAWASDEAERLRRGNPAWTSQGTVVLRFTRPLDAAALSEIHARMLKESRFRREVTEALARDALAEEVRISINPATLETRDPARAHKLLTESGLTAVASGFSSEVLGLADLLQSAQKSGAKVQLVLAYAYFGQGRYQQAVACAGEAAIRQSELVPDERGMLVNIRDACDCQLGRISRETYCERQAEAAARDGGVNAAASRVESVRFRHLGERDGASGSP